MLLQNGSVKDILSVAGTVFTPCFALMIWMYNNGIKSLKKDIARIFAKLDNHIQWHVDDKK